MVIRTEPGSTAPMGPAACSSFCVCIFGQRCGWCALPPRVAAGKMDRLVAMILKGASPR